MEKQERQEIALQKWKDNRGRGGFQHPTGFGKMYETITAIKRMYEKNNFIKVIIVVNSDALRKEWKSKIEGFMSSTFLEENCLIETIQYFQSKRLLHQCNILILDEVSQYFSEDRSNIWNGTWIIFKFLLWLDATPKDRSGRDEEFYSKYPCVDNITQHEAEQNNWISKSNIINIGVNFTPEELAIFEANEEIIDSNFNKFDRNFEEANRCLRGIGIPGDLNHVPAWKCCIAWAIQKGYLEEYSVYLKEGFPRNYTKDHIEFIQNICAIWTPDKVLGYSRKVMAALRERMDLIWNAQNKIQVVIDCLKYYPNSFVIIFSQRNEFASNICKAINNSFDQDIAVEYHSGIESRPLRVNNFGELSLLDGNEYATYVTGKKKGQMKVFGAKTIREVALAEIQSRKAKVLVSGSALDRGLDIPKIDLGIVVGFTQNESQSTQRKGRLTRIDMENSNKEAIFINVYVKGTKEEQFLRYTQKDKIEVKWLNHITDIDKQEEYDI